MKKVLIIFVTLSCVFVVYRLVVSSNHDNAVRKRLESAVIYPSYMTATYKKAEGGFCKGGEECYPRMEIETGAVNVTQALRDLETAVIGNGYAKSDDRFVTNDADKLCQYIRVNQSTLDKAKLVLMC